jgi:hypothetical protein
MGALNPISLTALKWIVFTFVVQPVSTASSAINGATSFFMRKRF